MATLHDLLKVMIEKGASDSHNNRKPPRVRMTENSSCWTIRN